MPANPADRPDVAIVILTWNGLQDTLECLESIRLLTSQVPNPDFGREKGFADNAATPPEVRDGAGYPGLASPSSSASGANPGRPGQASHPSCSFLVILVDNGSTDDTVAVVRANYPEVYLLPQTTNLGFAEGNNRGAKLAVELGARYLFFLNNDATVEPLCLERLKSLSQQERGLGIIGPLTFHGESAEIVPTAHSVSFWTAAIRNIPLVDRGSRDWLPADYVWGCGLFISVQLWERLGGFAPQYFAYFEDADLCLRARELGARTGIATQAAIRHKVSMTGNRIFWQQTWLRAQNHYRFLARHGRIRQRVVATPIYFLYRLPRFLYESVRVYVGLRRRGFPRGPIAGNN